MTRLAVSIYGEIRRLKRSADARFGLLSRLIQFCMVGASGMIVDLTCYAFLQWALQDVWTAEYSAPLVGGPLYLAVAAAFSVSAALVWNFSLNRRLTFNDSRHHGTIPRQFVTYVLGNVLSVAFSLTLRLTLPNRIAFFQRHKLAAAVVGIVAATGLSFSMSRWLVFGRKPWPTESRPRAELSSKETPVGAEVF